MMMILFFFYVRGGLLRFYLCHKIMSTRNAYIKKYFRRTTSGKFYISSTVKTRHINSHYTGTCLVWYCNGRISHWRFKKYYNMFEGKKYRFRWRWKPVSIKHTSIIGLNSRRIYNYYRPSVVESHKTNTYPTVSCIMRFSIIIINVNY